MRFRPRKRVVAALAVAGAMALSGCTVHPGDAAVVNGQSISESHIDDLVLAACAFSKVQRIANQGATPSTSMAFLRNFLLKNLITFKISHLAVIANHLTVSPAKIAQASGGQRLPDSLSTQDKDLLRQFFLDSARSQLEEAVIGAHGLNGSVTTADSVNQGNVSKLVQAGSKYMTEFTKAMNVQVNPAFGTWTGTTLTDTEGSLSAPVSKVAKSWILLRQTNGNSVHGLPASQVCG